jgi:hypothetical protein
MAKKSRPSKTSKPDVLKKTKIKKRTECTGFLARITITPETRAILEKIENKIILIVFSFWLYSLLDAWYKVQNTSHELQATKDTSDKALLIFC